MTVSTTSTTTTYTGNGVTTTFATDFQFLLETDLVVTVAGVTKTLNSHYTVTGGDGVSGSVVFLAAPADAAAVIVSRSVPLTQLTDYQPNDAFDAESHEQALDKLTQIDQQQQSTLERTFRVGPLEAEVAAISGDIGSKYLYLNASKQLTAVTGDPTQPITHTTEYYYPTVGETVVPVSAYTPGSGDLSVFVNGVLQVLTTDYVETSTTSITMTTALTAGDVVILSIGDVFSVTLVSPGVSEQSFTGLTTPVITLTTMSYQPGVDNVWVFFNGSKLAASDFTATNATTITLGFTPVAGDVMDVVVGQAIDSVAVTRPDVGKALYPLTAAEIAASVVPTDYAYPPGNALRYGAYSDTDNTATLQAGLNVCRYSKGRLLIPHVGGAAATTWITGTLAVYSETTVECEPGVVVQRKTGAGTYTYIFDCTNYSLGTRTLLTANVNASRKDVAVTSASNLSVGQTVVIREATYVDSGTLAGRWQEINEIEAISGLTVTLKNGLMLGYLTANGADLIPFTTANKDIVFRNVFAQIPAGVSGGLYKFNHAYRFRMINSGGAGMHQGVGVLCYYGTSCRVDGGTFRDGQSITTPGYAHAISWHEGSVNCHAESVSSMNVREHLFGYGAAFCSFKNCVDVGAATATWNSHGEGCHDCVIEGCTSIGAKQYGISIGGATAFPDYRITVRGNKVYGCGTHGIVSIGTVSFSPYDCVIEGNEIDQPNQSETASQYGIVAEYANRLTIRNNRIRSTSTNLRAGIYTYGGIEEIIDNNYINGFPNGWGIVYEKATDLKIRNNTGINLAVASKFVKWDAVHSPGAVLIEGNQADNDVDYGTLSTGAVQRFNQFKTKAGYASGATSVADGGTVTHGLSATPTKVRCTASVTGEFVSVTAVGATTFTLAIKTHANAAGTTQTVYWEAEV